MDLDPHFLSQTRSDICRDWLHQISVLRDEDDLKRTMNPEVAETLKSKRFFFGSTCWSRRAVLTLGSPIWFLKVFESLVRLHRRASSLRVSSLQF